MDKVTIMFNSGVEETYNVMDYQHQGPQLKMTLTDGSTMKFSETDFKRVSVVKNVNQNISEKSSESINE